MRLFVILGALPSSATHHEMTILDVQHTDDGHWHFKLGPVERWVVGIGALALTSMAGGIAITVNARLDEYGKSLRDLSTAQAVTNNQLATLSIQLADVPGLTRQLAETKVRVDDNTRRIEGNDRDIRELQQLRKLR
jgi:hypothetical protein